MKIVALIAEYNPFHNGHLYHMEKAKEAAGADTVLVVMSGDYVQRGAPALLPKHLRAQMALESGASVVLELPVCYAAGSAEYFAAGAVALLDSLQCVDAVCFGSECGNIQMLSSIARILADEPDRYKSALKASLREGRSFPKSRQMALEAYSCSGYGNVALPETNILAEMLSHPNNILGIEYLKALYHSGSKIEPYTIRRVGSGYHADFLSERYGCASAIRNVVSLQEDSISDVIPLLRQHMPASSLQILSDAFHVRYPVFADDFSLLLKHRLLSESATSLPRYMDVTEGIANRIMRNLDCFLSYTQFCGLLKTKELAYTRISRCLLHILLGITAADIRSYKKNGLCQYARILGFRKDRKDILSLLKKSASVPLITKLTRTDPLSGIGETMLNTEIAASDLYESILTDKYKTPFINAYRQQIVRV